jgi:hypothetical protein
MQIFSNQPLSAHAKGCNCPASTTSFPVICPKPWKVSEPLREKHQFNREQPTDKTCAYLKLTSQLI